MNSILIALLSSVFTLAPGETGKMPQNFVRVDTRLEASVSFKKFQPFAVGRGTETLYRSGWVEVTETEVVIYDVVLKNKILEEDHAADGTTKKTTARVRVPEETFRVRHGLNVKRAKNLVVDIDCEHESATLTIIAGKNSFETPLKGWWAGGEPFVKNLGTAPLSATLDFIRKTAGAPIWFIAASYFNSALPSRWPYYMRKEGYDNWMADHLPGGSSSQMLRCFKDDLNYGTPSIAVWMMMGNNKSDTDVIDPVWLSDTQEFLSICKSKGITPILTIYPYIGKNHSLKTEWVRSCGCRYVDLWDAMCNPDGSWKDPEWLGKDKVHPSKKGAQVMWQAFKDGVPEITR